MKRVFLSFYALLFLCSLHAQKIKFDQKNELQGYLAQRLSYACQQLDPKPASIRFKISSKIALDTFLIENVGSTIKLTAATNELLLRGGLQLVEDLEKDIRAKYIFEEEDGLVGVEAEHYNTQEMMQIRSWQLTTAECQPAGLSDGDSTHITAASGNAYLEILPDTRRNHEEQLIKGENFSNEPGKLGILHYKIYFNNPGPYYVWVRAYSTGSEDNGLHVGLNENWLESGQRMQWCEGKQEWTWASKQRTEEKHCGVERMIFIDIPSKGLHTISFSMREDGFEFDKFIIAKIYELPKETGVEERLYAKPFDK